LAVAALELLELDEQPALIPRVRSRRRCVFHFDPERVGVDQLHANRHATEIRRELERVRQKIVRDLFLTDWESRTTPVSAGSISVVTVIRFLRRGRARDSRRLSPIQLGQIDRFSAEVELARFDPSRGRARR